MLFLPCMFTRDIDFIELINPPPPRPPQTGPPPLLFYSVFVLGGKGLTGPICSSLFLNSPPPPQTSQKQPSNAI